MMTPNWTNIPVFILAGGLGTRLAAALSGRPKILAPVSGRTFIDILLKRLVDQGFNRIVLSVGYRKEMVFEHFANHPVSSRISFSSEDSPLGTGGAIWHARPLLESQTFIVLNGDSYCPVDLSALLRFHQRHQGICSLLLTKVSEPADFGTVDVDSDDRIRGFSEKGFSAGEAWINAGIYAFMPSVFDIQVPGLVFSLERDLFPYLAAAYPVYGMRSQVPLLDIGTPERLARAQDYFASKP